jgi:hypothetical protein
MGARNVTTIRRLATVGFVACSTFGLAPSGLGQIIENPAKFDVSPPLSSIQPPLKAQGAFLREHRVKKLPPFPPKAAIRADTVVQQTATTSLPIEAVVTFPGIGLDTHYGITSDPPDTNGSVGKSHYVQWVNVGLAVFDKATGMPVLGPVDGNLLWTGFGGNCEHFNDGDPIVVYDKVADRWLLTQFAVSGSPFSQCVAVSTSPDPTGTYARYEYQFQDFNDYPKFGVWPDAYYGTFNMFRGNAFVGAKICAFERAKMLAAGPARMQCFDSTGQGGILPSDLDGATPPPSGAPNYLMNFGNDRLNLWKFHVDWTNPGSSTLTGPTTIGTAPFEIACNNAPNPGACVIQPNTTELLDTLSDRLMFRLAYRNFGDHETLVVNHAVAAGGASGVRWYEVRDPGGTPTIFQQGTYAPDGTFRWMASIAMDKAQNVLMGYSRSGPQIFPSVFFTGRSASGPPNQLAIEKAAVNGTGSQSNPDRWGDYSSMSLDPTDDCTFWFSTQYEGVTGQFNWQTSIVRVRFSNCQ